MVKYNCKNSYEFTPLYPFFQSYSITFLTFNYQYQTNWVLISRLLVLKSQLIKYQLVN